MPVYAYVCKNCQHAFDIRQAFTDDALKECPECRTESLRKKFNTVGVSFKGSGFYSTDSKSSGSGTSGGSTSTTSSSEASGSSSSASSSSTSSSSSSGSSAGSDS